MEQFHYAKPSRNILRSALYSHQKTAPFQLRFPILNLPPPALKTTSSRAASHPPASACLDRTDQYQARGIQESPDMALRQEAHQGNRLPSMVLGQTVRNLRALHPSRVLDQTVESLPKGAKVKAPLARNLLPARGLRTAQAQIHLLKTCLPEISQGRAPQVTDLLAASPPRMVSNPILPPRAMLLSTNHKDQLLHSLRFQSMPMRQAKHG